LVDLCFWAVFFVRYDGNGVINHNSKHTPPEEFIVSLPLSQQAQQLNQPLRPLVYIHRLLTAHHIENKTVFADDGRALVFKQVIRLKK
jgi:hypothetical protein